MRSWIAALLVLAVACGPKKGPGSSGSNGDGAGGATGSASASAGGGASDGAGAGPATGGGGEAEAPLTRAECERMIDHVLAIGMEEQRKQKPAEFVPTEQQVAQIRASLVEQQLAPCLEWPRPVWACTMTATSVAALYTCAERP